MRSGRIGARTGVPALSDDFDDPLASMVNLFDIAMVFAVALVVALVFATDSPLRPVPDRGTSTPAPAAGKSVGRVLRLPDGRLVYTLEP